MNDGILVCVCVCGMCVGVGVLCPRTFVVFSY